VTALSLVGTAGAAGRSAVSAARARASAGVALDEPANVSIRLAISAIGQVCHLSLGGGYHSIGLRYSNLRTGVAPGFPPIRGPFLGLARAMQL
jgi:hypothetical protein